MLCYAVLWVKCTKNRLNSRYAGKTKALFSSKYQKIRGYFIKYFLTPGKSQSKIYSNSKNRRVFHADRQRAGTEWKSGGNSLKEKRLGEAFLNRVWGDVSPTLQGKRGRQRKTAVNQCGTATYVVSGKRRRFFIFRKGGDGNATK